MGKAHKNDTQHHCTSCPDSTRNDLPRARCLERRPKNRHATHEQFLSWGLWGCAWVKIDNSLHHTNLPPIPIHCLPYPTLSTSVLQLVGYRVMGFPTPPGSLVARLARQKDCGPRLSHPVGRAQFALVCQRCHPHSCLWWTLWQKPRCGSNPGSRFGS